MDSWLSLARALLAASRARMTGALSIATELGVARIVLDRGVPRAASALAAEADTLGDVLLRSGTLDPQGYREQLASGGPEGAIGEWLVQARLASRGEVERGILICGTGIGMAISANKFPGVRAAACVDEVTAELSRRHNDLNVLCLSGDLLSSRSTERLVEIWMDAQFEGGRHERRVEKIRDLEKEAHMEQH